MSVCGIRVNGIPRGSVDVCLSALFPFFRDKVTLPATRGEQVPLRNVFCLGPTSFSLNESRTVLVVVAMILLPPACLLAGDNLQRIGALKGLQVVASKPHPPGRAE